jgi:conjugal transfer pilus assembly protein TraV
MKLIGNLIILGVATLSIQGCSIGVGQDEFNCSSGDKNALCGSTRSIYTATNGELDENTKLTYIVDGEVHQTDVSNLDELKGSLKNPIKTEVVEKKVITDSILEKSTDQLLFEVSQLGGVTPIGDIMRTKAKIMKVGINTWIDQEDLFHMPSIILADIEARRWNSQENYSDTSASSEYIIPFKPIEVKAEPVTQKNGKANSKATVKQKN